MKVLARAHPNIALIKYWGKQNIERNLPAVGSLSITLDELAAATTVQPSATDSLKINDTEDDAATRRVVECLNRMRALSTAKTSALAVASQVNFPVAAGLASSAAGFAALTVAVDRLLTLELPKQRLAQLAGQASGSAARSLFGGFVRLDKASDSMDDIAVEQIAPRSHWPLKVVIAITSEQRKPQSSGSAMRESASSSPFYPAWCAGQDVDLDEAEAAVQKQDFEKLADLAEFSCLKMHAVAMAAQPGIIYWRGATLDAVHRVRELRAAGIACFFTIDAGPQVKAICLQQDAAQVQQALEEIPGVKRTLCIGLGSGASVA